MKKAKFLCFGIIVLITGIMINNSWANGLFPSKNSTRLCSEVLTWDEQDDEWILFNSTGGVELYSKKEFCDEIENLFVKIVNTNTHKITCEVTFTPDYPAVPSTTETHDIQASKSIQGNCDQEYLVFPAMKENDFEFEVDIK